MELGIRTEAVSQTRLWMLFLSHMLVQEFPLAIVPAPNRSTAFRQCSTTGLNGMMCGLQVRVRYVSVTSGLSREAHLCNQVHADQLVHVRRGCLERVCPDLPSDGSRIEGSHKGWNSIMRAHPSGIEMFTALAHDHVLRRNVRVAYKKPFPSNFVKSTFGSHHVRLISCAAELWNEIISCEVHMSTCANLQPRPVLLQVDSGECFGLVCSEFSTTFGGLFQVKEEVEESSEIPTNLEDGNSCLMICQSTDACVHTPFQPSSAFLSTEAESIDLSQSNSSLSVRSSSLIVDSGVSAVTDTTTTTTTTSLAIDVDAIPDDIVTSVKAVKTVVASKRKVSDSESPGSPGCNQEHRIKKLRIDGDKPQVRNSSSATEYHQTAQRTYQDLSKSVQPGTSGSCQSQVPNSLDRFFTSEKSLDVKTSRSETDTLAALKARLPAARPGHLSRSQQLFDKATGISPLALKINADEEFYTFMEMRAEQQWASFKMTSKRWAAVTVEYNTRLSDLCSAKNLPTTHKHPRALVEKLSEVEIIVAERLSAKNFRCKHSVPTHHVSLTYCFM